MRQMEHSWIPEFGRFPIQFQLVEPEQKVCPLRAAHSPEGEGQMRWTCQVMPLGSTKRELSVSPLWAEGKGVCGQTPPVRSASYVSHQAF